MDEFCYLSNVITKTSSCDKEIRTRFDIKANSTRLDDLKSEKSEITDQDQVLCINCTSCLSCCAVWKRGVPQKSIWNALKPSTTTVCQFLTTVWETQTAERNIKGWSQNQSTEKKHATGSLRSHSQEKNDIYGHVHRSLQKSETSTIGFLTKSEIEAARTLLGVTSSGETLNMTWNEVCLKAMNREKLKQCTARCTRHGMN